MYQNILVAFDGSSSSKLALKEAVSLAALTKGVVHPLYVLDKTPLFSYASHYDPLVLVEALRKEGEALMDQAGQACATAGVPCHPELVESNDPSDDVANVILRHAQQIDTDLLVMGTHGRRGVERLVIGSVAERALRFSRCPVLLIREEGKPESARL
ncbi:universal stress protein [Paraburkholderia sp.]|uniref:universal stress protein n=1 Tax=Paraburkholderia sp. TaxID=1926495 RepID=UPI002F407452